MSLHRVSTVFLFIFVLLLSSDSNDCLPMQIYYTICDEAPRLATYALLPVIRRFTLPYGISVSLLFCFYTSRFF